MALLEAIPLSLGIALEGDCFDIIIPRHTRIPCETTKQFFTVVNDQFSTSFEANFLLCYYRKYIVSFTYLRSMRAKGRLQLRTTFLEISFLMGLRLAQLAMSKCF